MAEADERHELRSGRISGTATLRRMRSAGWDELQAACVGDPLRRLAWLQAWMGEIGHDVEPRCLIVDRRRTPVAIAALECASRGGVKVVRHMGQDDAWFDIRPPARDDAALRALLTTISAEPGDVLDLDGWPADEDTETALRETLPGVRISPRSTWRLPVADPPRSVRKRRKEVGRTRRRAAERGVTLVENWSDDSAAIRQRIGALLDFHAVHFPRDEPNLLAGPGPRRRFSERAISAMADEGRVRLAEVKTDGGTLVAWDLAVVGERGRAVAYAGAFDRSLDNLAGLGWVSMMSMVDALAEEGVEELDFGPGPAAYKDLVAREVPLLRATAPLSRRGRLALAAHRARTALRARRSSRLTK